MNTTPKFHDFQKYQWLFIIIALYAAPAILYSQSPPPTIAWQHCYGGTNSESARCITPTTDGGYIFAGVAGSDDGDVWGRHFLTVDIWVVKINSQGSIEWQRCLGGDYKGFF